MKTALLTVGLLCSLPTIAQDFPGYRAGNFTGVNGVFFNPANIADSRYKFDFNLISTSINVANNQASFNLKDIANKSFETDSILKQAFGADKGSASGMVTANIHGPSFMVGLGKKTSIAVTSRMRVMTNIRNVDGKLVDKVLSDLEEDVELPYSINSNENMQVAIHGWTEFGFSFARVVFDQGSHFLKAGITGKYLAGAANGFVNINKLKGDLTQDAATDKVYLTNTTGGIGVGFGGVNVSNFEVGDLLKMESTGIGADIGVVYEFRTDEGRADRRDMNKYKLRLGVSLLDIGKIRYTRDMARSGSYDIHTGNPGLDLEELGEQELDEFKNYFDNHPAMFTKMPGFDEAEYDVSLPTTLQIDLDYNIHRGFYIHAGGQLSMAKIDNKPYNTAYYNGFSITPRFEGKGFGIYLPVQYNELTELNAGISLRFGPLFLGSGSAITALLGDSKQADFHFGLRFGMLQNKTKVKKGE